MPPSIDADHILSEIVAFRNKPLPLPQIDSSKLELLVRDRAVSSVDHMASCAMLYIFVEERLLFCHVTKSKRLRSCTARFLVHQESYLYVRMAALMSVLAAENVLCETNFQDA
jgi:hypothetical protein